ncbi:hypothetical protein [Alicyclobacillus pomorum]|nr:hypothetical protein [Alicyclobacillus pomorum]
MTQDKDQTHEQTIWELYKKKCRQEGTTPSVEGFKAWTTSLLKKLK